MRILFLAILVFSINKSFSQDSARRFYFKQVGWSIQLPQGFTILSADSSSRMRDRGISLIEKSSNIKADVSSLVTLFTIKKAPVSTFYSTLEPMNVSPKQFDSVLSKVKDILFNTLLTQIPSAKFDSSSSKTSIDELAFDKFDVLITLNASISMHMVLLTKLYRGFEFGICYLYTDNSIKDEIESSIAASKFDK